MMGLAAYGNDSIIKKFPLERWFKDVKGEIVCNSRINYPTEPFWEGFRKVSWLNLFSFFIYRIKHFFVMNVGNFVNFFV